MNKKLYIATQTNRILKVQSIGLSLFLIKLVQIYNMQLTYGGEKVIVDHDLGKRYSVDGFCEKTGKVYEFHGCTCLSWLSLCFDGRNDHPYHTELDMSNVYNETIRR